MRLALAAMPWQSVERPSLAVGLLHSLVRRECSDVDVVEYHGAIQWVERMFDSREPTPVQSYTEIGNSVLQGLGDWVFAGCLYGDPGWRVAEMRAYAEVHNLDDSLVEVVLRMRKLAPDFIEAAVTEILSGHPDVVGFTSTFMQNMPSLAAARRLKQLAPELRIVFGGANCDGAMGHALHRNHPFVDFVVRGEGELVFPALIEAIRAGTDPHEIPGVCWWNDDRSVANPQPSRTVPPGMIPCPNFDDWRDALERSPVREYVSPQLIIESSRGCWWGEKHQCTFCGLNGSLMTFRAKSADRFWDELSTLVRRHQILDVFTVDNIIDMSFFHSLLPKIAEVDWDLRIHYEVKSNLRTSQVEALAAAKVAMIQPGIESLSGRVLKLMDKGVDGATNVGLLRDCENNHITASWSYLYGFPGEHDEDYWSVIAQLPALVHLQPPGGATRIVLERFSPYFNQPELGFGHRRPAAFYGHVYSLADTELADLAYFFDSEPAGIVGDVVCSLEEAIDRWKRDYPYSFLIATDNGAEILIDDQRRGWPNTQHRLSGWHAVAYRALARRRSSTALRSYLVDSGYELDHATIEAWLRSAQRDGLVFVDDAAWVALATAIATQRVTTMAPDHVGAIA